MRILIKPKESRTRVEGWVWDETGIFDAGLAQNLALAGGPYVDLEKTIAFDLAISGNFKNELYMIQRASATAEALIFQLHEHQARYGSCLMGLLSSSSQSMGLASM